jgi:hypothetical protein
MHTKQLHYRLNWKATARSSVKVCTPSNGTTDSTGKQRLVRQRLARPLQTKQWHYRLNWRKQRHLPTQRQSNGSLVRQVVMPEIVNMGV